MQTLHVHLLPALMNGVDLSGSTAVVIDILRASTTIVHALVNGAQKVIPAQEVAQANQLATGFRTGSYLLGGERHGKLIEGFDLDNSPLKYTSDAVNEKTIVFTTTNGTKALKASEAASEVLIGAFVNLSAVVSHLKSASSSVHLVCAGTDQQLTGEDILFAGALVHELVTQQPDYWHFANVQTQLALDFYRTHSHTKESFQKAIQNSLGAQNLTKLGLNADIQRCMQRDLFDPVPIWNQADNSITLRK